MVEGLNTLDIGLFGPMVSDKAKGGIERGPRRRHKETRAGANNPEARLVDQRLDHVDAEVIYPGLCLTLFGIPDAEYQRECIRVYNDWLAEFCGGESRRLLGIGMLPITGLACATASLKVKNLVAERKAINKGIRDNTFAFLEKNNVKYIPSETNFFMMEVNRPGGDFAKAMADNKVMIGRVWPAWPTKVRVTVGTKEEMAKFQAAVSKIVG